MEEDRQTTEVRQTNEQVGNTTVQRESVATKTAVPGVVIAQRVIYYIAGFIIAFILLRFLFLLFGANQGDNFVDFVYSVSGAFVAPFTGIFGEPTFGQSHFETASLIAIAIYGLIAWGLARLLTISRPNEQI